MGIVDVSTTWPHQSRVSGTASLEVFCKSTASTPCRTQGGERESKVGDSDCVDLDYLQACAACCWQSQNTGMSSRLPPCLGRSLHYQSGTTCRVNSPKPMNGHHLCPLYRYRGPSGNAIPYEMQVTAAIGNQVCYAIEKASKYGTAAVTWGLVAHGTGMAITTQQEARRVLAHSPSPFLLALLDSLVCINIDTTNKQHHRQYQYQQHRQTNNIDTACQGDDPTCSPPQSSSPASARSSLLKMVPAQCQVQLSSPASTLLRTMQQHQPWYVHLTLTSSPNPNTFARQHKVPLSPRPKPASSELSR